MRRLAALTSLIIAAAAAASGCYDVASRSVVILPAPANLTYQVEPSGDPSAPSGILLRWDAVNDPDLDAYRVYSRASTADPYGLRGATTSTSFHDDGIPHLQYYVTALSLSGDESDPSNSITVDERLALDAPATLTSISLNGAVHLEWADNAYTGAPAAFSYYRVYSALYNLDSGLCGATWSLEGTTVAPEFLVGALANGVPMCFAVSAISQEGYESASSPVRDDTPRPDARNVLVYSVDSVPNQSGFRFWFDANGNGQADASELGLVVNGTAGTGDFYLSQDATGIYLVPQRTGTTMQVYGTTPVADLTSIGYAPNGNYDRGGYQALPSWGYVFQTTEGAYYQYGAVRVTAVGPDYVILDWSYQTDPGNPELVRVRR
jgi:hypothetical protein